MRNIFLILLLFAAGIFTNKASAQAVILKTDTLEVSCSATDTFLVPVVLGNFTNVSGLQFTLHWDSLKLDYAFVTMIHPQFFGVGFDTTAALLSSGNLTFAWTDLAGLSLPPNTVLFKVAFRRIGGSQTPISFADFPTDIAAFNNQFNEIPVETFNGLIVPLDDSAPSISCPANVTVQGSGATAVPDIEPVSATDNCGAPLVGWSSTGATVVSFPNDPDASGALFNLGSNTVTYHATDVGGNTANCTFNVFVEFAVTSTDLTLIASNVSATCGQPASIDIFAYNFDSIAGLQFSLEWLTTAMQYVSVSNLNAGLNIDISGFNTSGTGAGQLSFVWASAALTGNSVPDGTLLFTLNVNVLGAGTVTIGDNPTESFAFTGTVFPPEEVPLITVNSLVSVTDILPPTITCPANITVQAPGTTAVPGIAPVSVLDNCSAPLVGWSVTGQTLGNFPNDADASGGLFNQGASTVTYTATDAGGNTATCAFNVTVEFANTSTDLTIIANSATAACGGSFSIDVTALNFQTVAGMQFTMDWDTSAFVYTGLSNFNLPLGIGLSSFSLAAVDTGSITFAWTSGDLNGSTLNDGSVLFTLNFNLVGNSPSGFFFGDFPTLRLAFDGGTFDEIPMLTVNGQVNVADNVPPTITCPANVTVTAPQGQLFAPVSGLEPTTLSDNCGGTPTLTYTQTGATTATAVAGNANGNYNAGTTTVVYSATDGNNNTATCAFEVVVDAGTALVIQVDTVELGCQGVPTQVTINVSMDNFTDIKFLHFWLNWDPAVLQFDTLNNQFPGLNLSPSMFFNYVDTMTGLLKFFGGNQSWPNIPQGGIFFSITFNVLNPNALSGITISGPIEAVNSGFQNVPVVTVNGVFSSSVDNVPPVVVCPPSETINPPATECDATYMPLMPMVTDACGMIDTITRVPDGVIFGSGPTTITYTAVDEAGNSATCSFVVTVSDGNAPTLSGCPANITVSAASGACSAVANWTAPIFNDCSAITVDNNFFPGDMLPVAACMPTTVTYIATDLFGNSSTCTFNVLVVDVTPPSITCPADIVVFPVNSCDTILFFDAAVATDACDQTLDLGPDVPSGSAIPPGTTTVTFVALDDCSNLAECTFNITVVDGAAPVISNCPPNITVASNTNSCGANVPWTEPTATDICDALVLLTPTDQPGSFFGVGDPIIVTYTATDDSGNFTTCTFSVTVEDQTPPTLIGCPTAPLIVILPNSDCDTTLTWTPPTGADNCSAFTLVSNFSPGHNFAPGDTLVTYIVTDASGNADTCSFLVSVKDKVPPVLSSCPANITVNGNGACTAQAFWTEPTATDNCSVPTITAPFSSGALFMVGETTVQIIAEDASLNYDTCTFTVTVLGVPPGFDLTTLPANVEVNACDTVMTWSLPTALGFCNPATVTSNPPSPTNFGPGVHVITFTATDGVTSVTSTFVITVVEDVDPIILCPATAIEVNTGGVVLSGAGFVTSTDTVAGCNAVELLFAYPSATDNCAAPEVTQSTGPLSGGVFAIGPHLLTFVATDGAGNRAECSVTINVSALTALNPTADPNPGCLNETVVLTAPTIQGATYVWTKLPGTVLAATGSQYSITALTAQSAGIYTVFADVNGCLTPLDSIAVSLITAPAPQNDFFEIESGGLDTFNVFLNDGLDNPDAYEICATSPDPLPAGVVSLGNGLFAYQEQSGRTVSFAYQICYCGEPGEMATVSIILKDIPCTFIPNIITPNGDDLNDWLQIPCLDGGGFRENSLVVYNQWGDLVFEDKGYTNDPNDASHPAWRGTLNGESGKDLPDGVYYYIFKPGPNEKTIKGFVEIFR